MPYSKYNNRKIINEFGGFDSKREFNRYMELKQEQDDGMISNLQRQVPFEIIPKTELNEPRREGKRMRYCESAVKYFADFTYLDAGGTLIVEDVKSQITRKNAEYVLKRKLMLHVHGIQIKEIL